MKTMLETISEWFNRPAGQRFVKQVEHDHGIAVLEERRQWADQIRSAEEKYQSILPGLLKTEAELQQEREDLLKRHREELLQLDRRIDGARKKRDQATLERDRVVGPAERNLKTTVSSKIHEFWRALERRRQELGSGEHEFGTSHDGRQIMVRSSYPSLQRAALRILEIQRDVLQKLELEPLSDEELDARLAEIEASIPQVKMERLG